MQLFATVVLLDRDGGDGAVVSSLLSGVLSVLGDLVNSLGRALITDAEDLRAGALAKPATDAILANGSLHVSSSLLPGPPARDIPRFTRLASYMQQHPQVSRKPSLTVVSCLNPSWQQVLRAIGWRPRHALVC